MRSIVRGVVALFAAFLMMDVANAAPTIVSPADYSSISTMTETFKGYLDDPNFTSSYFNYEDYGEPNSVREAQREEFFKNSAPVTVSWSGAASGTSTVKIWRTHKDTSSTPVFTKTTTESSVTFFDLEIGRNYTWTVTDSAGETATGHFYTLRHAPRMIKSYNTDTEGSACSNGRDIGGRLTADGTKAVKQGLIYRTAQLEYCNPRNADGIYGEMTWLKNVLGIKLDIDLRDASHLTTFYVGPITEGNSWTEKELTDEGLPMTLLGKHHFNYVWKNNSHLESVDESSIGDGVVRCCVPAKTGHGFPSWAGFFSNDTSKQSVWYAFNTMYESVKKGEPLIFHCSHGKDRGGTLAYVIHGVLGITKSEATKDFLISWFDNPDETVATSSITTKIVNNLKTYNSTGTLKQQCEAYLKECGVKSGLTSQQAADKIADFQLLMLEDIETADEDPNKITAPVAVTGLVYNGSELTGVTAGTGYTLTGNTAVDAGTHTAVATLAEGYKWADGSTDNKEISWSIAKATNEWTTEPSISLTEWTQGEEAGVLTAGVAKFGDVTSSMTELPTEVGSYTITYTVEENNNYNGLTKTIAFEIKAAVVVEPDPEEPDPEEPGTGGEDPSEKPKLTIDDKFGYVRTGLGELGDQAVVVFTNSAEAATWQAPRSLKNVEILVVGGGGGGGGHYYSSTTKNCQDGSGGGAGAVVTGFIKDLAPDQVVNVTVGAGGAGGITNTSSTAVIAAGNGGNSSIKVGDLTYVTAYGGGGDGGKDSTGVANGGSNSGARAAKAATSLKSVTVVGAGAENLVTDIVARANKGGSGYSTNSGYPGTGGGGASGVGGSTSSSNLGGTCGYGYVSMITGNRVVYGAGGGGGIGKNGGSGTAMWDDSLEFVEGAGIGTAGKNGSDALPNQGGGGGGGSWLKNGGAGGSGIVVLRFAYSETDIPVDVTADIISKISDKVYTGEALSSGLVETYAYTVEELNECVNAGAKVVRVTLNEGYVWADGAEERYKDFTWNILKQDNNVWVTTPFINVDSWGETYTGNVIFHKADPLLGNLISTIAKDDGEDQPFNGTLPSEPGTYKLIYKVEGTDNFSSLYWEKTFKIYESETFAGGYKVYGLGDNGDEVAVVFTSTTDWTVPQNVKNVEFLVVGGGGGGGADTGTSGEFQGGAGGGGGGVITGVIKEFSANSTVTITVGAGGKAGDNGIDNSGFGAGSTGEESSIALGTTKIVTAKGGGRDAGATALGKYTDGNDGDIYYLLNGQGKKRALFLYKQDHWDCIEGTPKGLGFTKVYS
ncbi:MAG: tyrosine-protein phosphatase, partial [Kiritimatiellae bacterium]|nr:tyrosine-protein phosphatase [Kiritimatiellia bacterium]